MNFVYCHSQKKIEVLIYWLLVTCMIIRPTLTDLLPVICASFFVINLYAQCERGKVIGVGVHIGMFVDKKKLESYFSD